MKNVYMFVMIMVIINEKHIVNYETMYFREDVFLMFTILENHYKTRFVSTLDEITEMFFNNKVLTIQSPNKK